MDVIVWSNNNPVNDMSGQINDLDKALTVRTRELWTLSNSLRPDL